VSQALTPQQTAQILNEANKTNEAMNALILGLGEKQLKKHNSKVVDVLNGLDFITCMVKEGITPEESGARHLSTVNAKEAVEAMNALLDSILSCEVTFNKAKPHLKSVIETLDVALRRLGSQI